MNFLQAVILGIVQGLTEFIPISSTAHLVFASRWTNIYDGNPAKPAKLTTTTGAWRWDFGGAKQLDVAAIIHHNLTAGLNVRIQGNATDAWGAPSLDQATTPVDCSASCTRRT